MPESGLRKVDEREPGAWHNLNKNGNREMLENTTSVK